MKSKLTPRRINHILRAFPGIKVLVLGDLMVDEYLFGKVSRISPEAPVPVVDVERETFLLGGSANVAWNIASLGGSAVPVGVVGRDRGQRIMAREFKQRGISGRGLVGESGRHTTIKTRIVAHQQQVVRVDREHRHDLSAAGQTRIVRLLEKLIPQVDALLIQDYNKGVITSRVLQAALDVARRRGTIVTVDPKFSHFFEYRGVTLFKPNILETERALGMKIDGPGAIAKAGRLLIERLAPRAVLITAGEHGMYLFVPGSSPVHIPTVAREVFDVSGAGDTVIAVCTMCLAARAGFVEAANIANHAAGIEVSKFGVAAVTPKELQAALRDW